MANLLDNISSFGKQVGGVADVFNSTVGRLFGAGLTRGAEAADKLNATARWNVRTNQTDWRVKLTLPSDGQLRQVFFGADNSVMQPLKEFNGIVFPLTPAIIINHTAAYNALANTHSNYPFYAYGHSEIGSINVIGNFPVQNSQDARHWIATLHFLRAVTKMFFGGEENDPLRGNPPPVLQLNGYGNYVFSNVPVVVTNFTVDLRDNVDYISTAHPNKGVNISGLDEPAYLDKNLVANAETNSTWAPTDSQFNVTLQPIYSRDSVKKFSMKEFVNGNLVNKDGIGFI